MVVGQPNWWVKHLPEMMIAAWAHSFCCQPLVDDLGVYECEKIGISTTEYKSRILTWKYKLYTVIKSKLVCGMFTVLQTCPFGQTMQDYQLSTNINESFFICGLGWAHFFRTKKDRKQIRSCKASQDWKTRHPFRPVSILLKFIPARLTLQGLNLSHQIFLKRCWIWGVWARISQCLAALLNKATTRCTGVAPFTAAGCRWKVWAMALRDDFWRRCAFGTELHVESVRNCWKPPTFRCSEEGSCSFSTRPQQDRWKGSALPAINTRFFPSCLTLSAWNKSIYSIQIWQNMKQLGIYSQASGSSIFLRGTLLSPIPRHPSQDVILWGYCPRGGKPRNFEKETGRWPLTLSYGHPGQGCLMFFVWL
jgi:hypothetical protein